MKCARIILATISILVACGAAPQQPSQPYVWRNVKVVAGGFIPGIVFSRVEKGLAYLRSDMGGCYRWDASDRRWMPMHDHFGESSYFGGESIAPDPIDADVVYIAAGMYRNDPSAILRSRDKGKTWEIFPVSFRMGGNEDGRGVGERLAVDPNDNRILYFGSRHDGLMRSSDRGETWHLVESFPLKGRGLPEQGKPTNGGMSFVVFDPRSGARGAPTNTIFVGSTDPGSQPHLYRSDDAGHLWTAIDGPKPDLLPVKAEIDDAGVLYITYANGIGPNGVTDGAVMKLDTKTNRWTDITPDKRPDRPKGGYMGLSLDRQHPGTLAVATMNRWSPVDTVWRSTDGGQTWHDIFTAGSERDVSLSPFLLWGQEKPKLGWWMATLAIDPFDSDHAAYATGATVYATNDFSRVSNNEPTHWHVWADGIEQTAVITLISPSAGAHLLSGFGDIGGFVHDELDRSPPRGMYDHPMFGNTNTLDYAELQSNLIVRSGQPHEGEPPLAWSDDGGRTWHGMTIPSDAPVDPQQQRRRWRVTPALVTSADGSTFMLMTRTPMISRDRGQTWTKSSGLPERARPVPDRLDPAHFYVIDFQTAKLYTSTDGGATFAASNAIGLPDDLAGDEPTWHEAAWPLVATLGKSGDLWLVSKSGLFHSTDAGRTFTKNGGGVQVEALSFGKAPEGKDYPALFAIGTNGNDLKAIWRSDDAGQSWIRINDDRHQYGTRFRCIAGDPRVFGRVYVGTDGRGIVYGEPASAREATMTTTTTRQSSLDRSDEVKVCQVGYLPGEAKFALITGAKTPGGDAIIRRATDGSAVLSVPVGEAVEDADSGDRVRLIDFSKLTDAGTYYIEVPGVGTSYDFGIGPDVFTQAFRLAMRAFTGQRCGTRVTLAPDFPEFHHDACHTAPAQFHASSGKTGPRDCTGGWHDAGDYGRYVVNSGITTGTLLWAYELNAEKLRTLRLDIPESGGAIPDTLAEIKWNLDWMLKMQDADDGGVWHKATSANFCGFVLPEDDHAQVLIIGSGQEPYKTTEATADFAAVCAIAARVYHPFDAPYADRCRTSAERAWTWASAHPDVHFARNPEGIRTGGYGDKDAADELLWAAAELFRTTGKPEYNDYFVGHFAKWNPTLGADAVQGWPNVQNLGMYTYALCAGEGAGAAKPNAQVVAKIKSDAVAAADAIVARSQRNAYRIALRSNDYYWGSNSVVANYAMMVLLANRFSAKPEYTNCAQDAIHYLLGRNTFDTSFVTQLGSRWPMHPHHRPSAADGIEQPWPGMLVGGPNANGKSPPARQWLDDQKSFTTNEIAINWNAPLVFLLAEALPEIAHRAK